MVASVHSLLWLVTHSAERLLQVDEPKAPGPKLKRLTGNISSMKELIRKESLIASARE